MNNKTAKIMVAFAIGQIVQVVLNVLSRVAYMTAPVLFCGAAGFLFFMAIVSGIALANSDSKVAHEKKTYMDWAEIPNEEKVVNPFADE